MVIFTIQVTGLALRIAGIIGGAITVETVLITGLGENDVKFCFKSGLLPFKRATSSFLAVVVMASVANFLVDIVYMFIDPRVRHSFAGEV